MPVRDTLFQIEQMEEQKKQAGRNSEKKNIMKNKTFVIGVEGRKTEGPEGNIRVPDSGVRCLKK